MPHYSTITHPNFAPKKDPYILPLQCRKHAESHLFGTLTCNLEATPIATPSAPVSIRLNLSRSLHYSHRSCSCPLFPAPSTATTSLDAKQNFRLVRSLTYSNPLAFWTFALGK